ncbi:MAG: hypothetical protein U0703_14210 [Anaerolineae bacterium]
MPFWTTSSTRHLPRHGCAARCWLPAPQADRSGALLWRVRRAAYPANTARERDVGSPRAGAGRRFYDQRRLRATQFVALRIDLALFTFRVHYRPGDPLNLEQWRDLLPNHVRFHQQR